MSSNASTGADSFPFENVLQALVEHARRSGTAMMLVGATARDVALSRAGINNPLRATNDVDIVVAVADEGAFARVIEGLQPAALSADHKFVVDGVEVDIVPFGGIEAEDRTITWPDGNVMNTLGFAEAIELAADVTLSSGDSIKVATVESLCALKLFAWADRKSWTSRDAVDMRALIHAYSEGDFHDGIYADDRYPLLERYDFAPRVAGAHWLGQQIRDRLGNEVASRCLKILDETHSDLAIAMRENIDENNDLLNAVANGLRARDD